MAEATYQPLEIAPGVFWVGAVDWDVREFHGHHYHTARGTTYNAYLVRGERTALVDTVHAPFAGELFARLEPLLPLPRLDYLVVNHVESDHSGALPQVMARAPRLPSSAPGAASGVCASTMPLTAGAASR